MNNARVILKRGEGRSLKQGGSWIFDNEIREISGDYSPGDILPVADFDGYPLGQGFVNPYSKIRVRLLTRNAAKPIDEAFFEDRLQRAWDYRTHCVDTNACRFVFGEADGLPGLVMDKYADVLVTQFMSLGMDRLKERMVRLARLVLDRNGFRVRGVYERSDAKEREKEGLERVSGFLGEPFDTDILIRENDIQYRVDVAKGQKTGFFLDQKYNRLAIRPLCANAKVLDCFTNTGSFALNACMGGAATVLGIDASREAISQAERNALLNGMGERTRFLCADTFDQLSFMEKEGEQWDVIILDPPAFTKSRNSVRNALKGYREINMRAMRLLRDGGYLATCSCSHFVDAAGFSQMLREAAAGARRVLRQVECRSQSPDHPILWGAGESEYLKFYILQVCHRE